MTEPSHPVDLAVVGHTNTGKTSLMRTLLRNEHFGEVADRPGTTRQVESARLLDEQGRTRLILRDTPGLEDAMGMLEYLEQLTAPTERLYGPERIARLLASPEATRRFEQESRVLTTVQAADAALYVVDTRDPVLPRHRDELMLLQDCGRPILPVLNFTRHARSDSTAWRQAFSGLALHVMVDFDTVAPALDGEARLFERLAILLDAHADTLQALRADLAHRRAWRRRDAMQLIADLVMDAAALRLTCAGDAAAITDRTDTLRHRVREREQAAIQALLQRYQFSRAVFPHTTLPLQGERWETDLFSPLALRQFGLQLGKGLATGAAAGATIDVLTGGLSLGSATLLGALAGGAWQGSQSWGRRLAGRLMGQRELTVDDPVLHLLVLRQLALVQALEGRGHAATRPLDAAILPAAATQTPGNPAQPLPEPVRQMIRQARSHPEWSTLTHAQTTDPERDDAVKAAARALLTQFEAS